MLVVLPTPRRRLGGALGCGGRVCSIAACACVVRPCGVGRVGVAISRVGRARLSAAPAGHAEPWPDRTRASGPARAAAWTRASSASSLRPRMFSPRTAHQASVRAHSGPRSRRSAISAPPTNRRLPPILALSVGEEMLMYNSTRSRTASGTRLAFHGKPREVSHECGSPPLPHPHCDSLETRSLDPPLIIRAPFCAAGRWRCHTCPRGQCSPH
jgi:hypothetical protein